MEGGGFPVFINKGDLYPGLGIASDQGGNGFLVKPSLNGSGALVENPCVGVDVLDQDLKFTLWVLKVEELG